MVLINKAINEVTVKLVYYGPGLCGKTTNLEKIYGNPRLENKGKMIVTIACSTGERYLSTALAAEAKAEVGG